MRWREGIALAVLLLGSMALWGCGPAGGEPRGTLAFEVEEGGQTDIYVMDLDGRNRRNLTQHPAWDGTPAWSPDGEWLAFASDRAGTPDLYLVRADGSDLRRLTDWDAVEIMPAWSPDGSMIAFATDRAYQEQREGGVVTIESGLEVWVMRPDGSSLRRLTGDPNDVAIYPAWSPDGKQVVYQNISSRSDVVAVDLLSGVRRNLTEGLESANWSPAWSPTHNWVLFTGDNGENKDIFRMKGTGGEPVNLTDHPASDADPAWSPDGRWVAFVSDRSGVPQIFVM
ncbi:MAG: PD40 domain-containing protein, partial [Anaerolineae bacterium]|nr:PD40 domain-containing protein [Anaerolineae bacterium]